MSAKVYDAEGRPRQFGFYRGFVVNNADPEKVGRVTCRVPGLIEPESGWAWPMAMGGGSPQNGSWDVPKIGANIYVLFHQGDVDEPHYMHGWYGRGMPSDPVSGASASDAANKIKCFETDRHLVVLDGADGKVIIKDKESSTGVIVIEKDKITVGGERLMMMQGALNGEAMDPFTNMPHWMLGNASKTVFLKKG